MEYVIVEFAESREVMVDEANQGPNKKDGKYRLLRLTEGLHTVKLGGAQDYEPSSQTVVIDGTSPINPLRIVFKKKG